MSSGGSVGSRSVVIRGATWHSSAYASSPWFVIGALIDEACSTVGTAPRHHQVGATQDEHHPINHGQCPLPGGIYRYRRFRDGGSGQRQQPPGHLALCGVQRSVYQLETFMLLPLLTLTQRQRDMFLATISRGSYSA